MLSMLTGNLKFECSLSFSYAMDIGFVDWVSFILTIFHHFFKGLLEDLN